MTARPARTRVHGCLLGAAIGDALGHPFELSKHNQPLLTPRETRALAGRFGGSDGPPARLSFFNSLIHPPPARISDDTQMMLFTAEALIFARAQGAHSGAIVSLVRDGYRRWCAVQDVSPWPGLVPLAAPTFPDPHGLAGMMMRKPSRWAPGVSSLAALAKSHHAAPPTIDAPPNASKGCGAVVRAAPCGVFAATREEAFRLGRDTAVLTHGHPSGYLPAAYFSALVHDVLRRVPLRQAMDSADALLLEARGSRETRDAIERARSLARRGPTAGRIEAQRSSRLGVQALAVGLACALSADTEKPDGTARALWRAAAHTGAAATTAAITGALLGATGGVAGLPATYRREVDFAEEIAQLANELGTALAS